jgi:hypothetical protein
MGVHNYDGYTIITVNVCPPIPFRGVDWAAYIDEWGADSSPYGRGETEREAVCDLLEQLE